MTIAISDGRSEKWYEHEKLLNGRHPLYFQVLCILLCRVAVELSIFHFGLTIGIGKPEKMLGQWMQQPKWNKQTSSYVQSNRSDGMNCTGMTMHQVCYGDGICVFDYFSRMHKSATCLRFLMHTQ